MMKLGAYLFVVGISLSVSMAPCYADEIPSGRTLRAVYLGSNPAQATRDPATGAPRGPAYELAKEIARRFDSSVEFTPLVSPSEVIDAVRRGDADLGFVAYEVTRTGTVNFSQTYMLVQQSFLVTRDSPIVSVAQIDQAGHTLAGTSSDSITLCMKRTIKHAGVRNMANDPALIAEALIDGEISAFGANRQRLTTLAQSIPGARLLDDDFFNVPQNIVIAKDRPLSMKMVNATIDALRASGRLQEIITTGALGVLPAPANVRAGCPG